PEMRGEAVGLFDYAFHPEGDGRTAVSTSVAGYLQIDSRFIRVLGKVALPLVQAKADKESSQLLPTFAPVSPASENDPARVFTKVSERPDVPRQELEQFRAVLRLP